MKRIIIFIILIFLYITVFSQERYLLDTVKVNVDDKAIVEIISSNYSKIYKIEEIDTILKQFQDDLKKKKSLLLLMIP